MSEQIRTPQAGGVRELFSLAFPIIVSTACDGIMIFTDRLMLSKLGPDAMNAAMSGGVSIQVAMFFFIGLTGYATALAAQYFGAGQKKNSSAAAFQAFLVALVSVPVVLLWLKPAGFLSGLLGVSDIQKGLQSQYMLILAIGSVFGMTRHVISCFFSGTGRPKIVMLATLFALTVNVAVGYSLIFGKFGLPQLGIRGAAIGAVSGWGIAAFILLLAYFGRKNREEFSSGSTLRFDGSIMKKLLRFGYPAGLEMFLNFFAFSAMLQIFQSLGSHVATATTITFNWDLIAFIPLLGIEIAVTSLVGRYMGAGNPVIAEKTVYSAVKIGMFYSGAAFILFALIPGVLVGVFRPDTPTQSFSDAVPLASSMIRLASLYVLAEAMMCAFVGALRGAGDTFFTMVWSVSAHWIFVILMWVMLKVLHLPPLAGWVTVIVIFLVFCGILFIRFRSGHWTRIRVIGEAEPEAE